MWGKNLHTGGKWETMNSLGVPLALVGASFEDFSYSSSCESTSGAIHVPTLLHKLTSWYTIATASSNA